MSDRPLTEREEELVDAMNEYYERLAEIGRKYADPEMDGDELEKNQGMVEEINKLLEDYGKG
jgi:hypothetical protein